jgi:predicted nucleotidyltransferase
MARGQDEVISIVSKYLELLEREGIRVLRAYLFGSYAAGRAESDSDIDVAIVSDDLSGDRVKDMVRLKLLTEKVDLDIWPHPYSTAEYDSATDGSFLKEEVVDKGLRVH